MSSGDRLNYSREKIFKTICENLPKSDGKTKNLIDCKDDIIFVWDSVGRRLLTQNVKVPNKDTTIFQELHPTEPPVVDIHFLRINSSISKAALWGPAGVMVMDIPRRLGFLSGFQGGKPVILTRCIPIDIMYFFLHHIEIRQVRFHPGSLQDNHLVILTSTNTFRVYKLSKDDVTGEGNSNAELVHVWNLSLNPIDSKGWNLSGSKVPFLASLGDMAVDFDFALSVLDDDVKEGDDFGPEKVVWPAIILRGNGDVYILNTSLISNEKPKFEGPLTMYPPADDNYGVEACSILVLSTIPNIIIVATSSGTVYHSVLLKDDGNEKSVVPNTSRILNVLECIELELGIQLNDDDTSYTCPIILSNDPVFRYKYYCTHNTGLHAVSVSFGWELEGFIEQSSLENIRLRLDQRSTVEYLVCTRTNTTPILPVLGFAIIASTKVILVLLANAELVSLPHKFTEVIMKTSVIADEVVNEEMTPIKKLLQEPFDIHIRNMLKKNINQPLMKLDKNVNLSLRDSLDLIARTTNILRQEYFTKFQNVKDEIEQRAMTLKALHGLLSEEFLQLENEKALLQEVAEKLAEKYEEIKDKQQVLNQRIEDIVSAVLQVEPIESLAEKKMKNELLEVEEKMENFEKLMSKLKKKMDYQKYKKAEHKLEKQKSIQLGGNQIETIKTSLNKTSHEIAELVKAVNAIKKHLNISD